jgi:cytidine deaminase
VNDAQLADAARTALERAYAPYSGFRVGAAILGESGRVWTGSNIEIATSGVSLCAERVALAKAVSEGERRFVRLVLVAEDPEPVTPCGVCRQTLQEFGAGMSVLMLGTDGLRIDVSLSDLIPFPFERKRKA